MVKHLVKNAVQRMLDTGEFDKIRNMYYKDGNTDAATDVDQLKRDLQDAVKALGSISEIPIIPLVQRISDIEVWKDIVCFMMSEEQRENTADDTGN